MMTHCRYGQIQKVRVGGGSVPPSGAAHVSSAKGAKWNLTDAGALPPQQAGVSMQLRFKSRALGNECLVQNVALVHICFRSNRGRRTQGIGFHSRILTHFFSSAKNVRQFDQTQHLHVTAAVAAINFDDQMAL